MSLSGINVVLQQAVRIWHIKELTNAGFYGFTFHVDGKKGSPPGFARFAGAAGTMILVTCAAVRETGSIPIAGASASVFVLFSPSHFLIF